MSSSTRMSCPPQPISVPSQTGKRQVFTTSSYSPRSRTRISGCRAPPPNCSSSMCIECCKILKIQYEYDGKQRPVERLRGAVGCVMGVRSSRERLMGSTLPSSLDIKRLSVVVGDRFEQIQASRIASFAPPPT